MRRIAVDPFQPDEELVRTAADEIRRGGVVAYPTDTLYGLAVDPCSDAAVERLFGVKGRDAAAAVALIAADYAQAESVGTFGALEKRMASALWPGPLTIVVPASAVLSRRVHPGLETIGVRVPAHRTARLLAASFGGCITATSANISGRPSALSADEIAAALGDEVDIVLDAGPAPGAVPSTVVEVVEGQVVLHRAGAVAWDRVLESLK